jgi:hypothetical protein
VFNEGPAGVANAVKNLWRNIGAYTTGLVSYVFSGGNAPAKRTDGGEPITGRDLIALLATIGVDLGLLALAIVNPPRQGPSLRFSGSMSRQIQDSIRVALNTAALRAGTDYEWVRRHFIHHNRASYLVIPNLYSADPENKDEGAKALAMNQLAGVLSDLDLVRWPDRAYPFLLQKSELARLKAEESATSDTDLSEIRRKWRDEKGLKPEHDGQTERPIRNHGLFSKAERALEFAGWGETARKDIEVFRIVDAEGLTPLLMVLKEPGTTRRAGQEEPAAAR